MFLRWGRCARGRWQREGEMAEASSATTNRGDSAALVRKQVGLFTVQKMHLLPGYL